ncbi:MAG: MGH1-like glycoside hydrolase domain-containing protein, partial [Bacteroidales bacterium]
QAIPNEAAWEWMDANIPLFECPQDNFEEIYYYRWWTLRKHVIETPAGYAFTEFLVERSYADRYNLIACAIGHHIMEGRWLKDNRYLNDYMHVWYRGNGGQPMEKLHGFSSYTPYALLEKYKVDGDREFLTDMFRDLEVDYRQWESEKRLPSGLFWQRDVNDGMEESISGGRNVRNVRPTINSYMYGNAVALSKIAAMAGDSTTSRYYRLKADTLRQLVQENLWNPDSRFFETVKEDGSFAGVREAIGYIPWMVHLPDRDTGYGAAWRALTDPEGFLAPFGLTTAEQRHPEFRTHGCCNCEWDGAVWPFATSQTLTALQHFLRSDQQETVSSEDYFRHMERYVESQYYRGRPYIGEYLDETTGYWLKGDQERSRYYNHSTFNDLMITGLMGLVPRLDDVIEVDPLIPEDQWDWFCLDRVRYRGRILTILWDRDGSRYHQGKGLHLLVDGRRVAGSETLGHMTFDPAYTETDN